MTVEMIRISTPPHGFRLKPLAEIMGEIQGAQYLIKPFLERDCIGTLFGDSDTYKSFIAIDLSLCIAHGHPFHGYKVNQGAVIYIAGEGSAGISRRVTAWHIHHGLKFEGTPFYLANMPVKLVDNESILACVETMISQLSQKPVLIVLDTLSTNLGDADESSNRDMALALGNTHMLIREQTGACVMLVHHCGHSDKGRERGAYAIRGNVDFRIQVERIAEPMACAIKSMKVKDGKPFPPLALKAEVISIPNITDSEGEGITSLVLGKTDYHEPVDPKKLPDQQFRCLAVLKILMAEAKANLEKGDRDPNSARVEVRTWKEEVAKKNIITGKTKSSMNSAWSRIRGNLKQKNLVREDNNFAYPVDLNN
jgi:hypothetical protein